MPRHSSDNCHKEKKCKKCIIALLPPPPPEPFIGMSVFKDQNLEIPSGGTDPIVIGNWSDERINGIRRFYITPDESFDTVTGLYTITKKGKYRSAVNIQTENNLECPLGRGESITFAFKLYSKKHPNGRILHEFFARGNVRLETVSTTLTLKLNEGEQIQLLAYPINRPEITCSYIIRGTVNQNTEPIRTNWSLSRFAD